MFKTSIRDGAYRRTLAFLSAACLFLIVFGSGLALVGADLPNMVKQGRMSESSAWWAFGAGIATFLFLAVFMAHHLILFVNAMIGADREVRYNNTLKILRGH